MKALDPWYQNCTDLFFTAFDPPRTLEIAAAMVSDAKTSDSTAPPIAPTPSPSFNYRPTETNIKDGRGSTSSDNEAVTQASDTIDRGTVTQWKPKLQISIEAANRNSVQQISTTADPGKVPSPSPYGNASPASHTLSNEVSQPVAPDKTSHSVSIHVADLQGEPTMYQYQDHSSEQVDSQLMGPQTQAGIASAQGTSGPQLPSGQDFKTPSAAHQQGHSQPQFSEAPVSASGSYLVMHYSSIPTYRPTHQADNNWESAAHVSPPSLSDTFEDERQTIHVSAPVDMPTATFAGYAIAAIPKGASIHGTTVVAGAPPIIIQGTSISVDASNRVFVGGVLHQLPTPSLAPTMALANSAAVVPVQNGFSIYGTTLEPGAPAITASGTAISFDDSGDLILAGGATSHPQLPASLSSKPWNLDHGTPFLTSNAAMTATTAVTKAVETLSPGALAVTVNGVAVSLDSADGLVVGSETLAMKSASGGLGGMIMGGIQSGGPYSTNSTAVAQTTSPTVSGTSPGIAPASQSRADGIKSLSPWKIVATLLAASAIVCLHV